MVNIFSVAGICAIATDDNGIMWVNDQYASNVNSGSSLRSAFSLKLADPVNNIYNSTVFRESFVIKSLLYKGQNLLLLLKSGDAELNSENSQLKGLAHDLNNIFTNILNSIDFVKETAPSHKEKKNKLYSSIEHNTLKAIEITDSFLGKENPGLGKTKTTPQYIINEVLKTVQFKLNNHVTVNVSNNTQENIYVSQRNIYRAFLNIVTNSIEAIQHESGKIEIELNSVGVHDKLVEFSFKDNGTGIDEIKAKQMFDKGFSTKSRNRESGLGLFVAKQFIEENDGTIDVVSKSGSGTTIKVAFPAYKKPEKLKEPRTVLIADDETVVRELLSELLSGHNIKVLQAKSGEEALSIFKGNNTIDLIIIDKKMSGMDGLECASQVRQISPDIPIILASGSYISEKIDIEKYGISFFLEKPYNFDELHKVIKKLI